MLEFISYALYILMVCGLVRNQGISLGYVVFTGLCFAFLSPLVFCYLWNHTPLVDWHHFGYTEYRIYAVLAHQLFGGIAASATASVRALQTK